LIRDTKNGGVRACSATTDRSCNNNYSRNLICARRVLRYQTSLANVSVGNCSNTSDITKPIKHWVLKRFPTPKSYFVVTIFFLFEPFPRWIFVDSVLRLQRVHTPRSILYSARGASERAHDYYFMSSRCLARTYAAVLSVRALG
jgi:hypothetical protein